MTRMDMRRVSSLIYWAKCVKKPQDVLLCCWHQHTLLANWWWTGTAWNWYVLCLRFHTQFSKVKVRSRCLCSLLINQSTLAFLVLMILWRFDGWILRRVSGLLAEYSQEKQFQFLPTIYKRCQGFPAFQSWRKSGKPKHSYRKEDRY